MATAGPSAVAAARSGGEPARGGSGRGAADPSDPDSAAPAEQSRAPTTAFVNTAKVTGLGFLNDFIPCI